MSHDPEHTGGYEKQDINPGKIVFFATVMIVFLAVGLFFLDDYFIYEKEKLYKEMVLEPENPQLLELRAREDSVLSSYGLADSAAAEYRIPLDSAMKQVAAEAGGNN